MAGYSQEELVQIIKGLEGLAGAEKFKFSEILFLASFEERDLKNDVILVDGVRDGNVIPIFGRQDDFTSFETASDEDCTPNVQEIKDNWGKYKFKMGEIDGRLPLCMKRFTVDFNIFFNNYVKLNGDDVNSAIVEFIAERFQVKLNRAQERVYFFGDVDSTSKRINSTNGVITQGIAQASAPDADLRVVITENADSSKFTSGRQVYDYIAAMLEKASDKPYFNPAELDLYLDREDANKLVTWLNLLNDTKDLSCECLDPNKIIGSRVFEANNLKVFGMPVKVYPFQLMMQASGDTWYNETTNKFVHRHVMLLVKKTNILLGYEIEETLKSFNIHYNPTDRKIYIDGGVKMAPALPTDEFIIAY